MSDQTRQDIRKLLKTFGIEADETITAFIAENPGVTPLRVRITLEDLTDYGGPNPANPLHLQVEGAIMR